MPEQCECAQLDWSNVDLTSEHHPDCERQQLMAKLNELDFDDQPKRRTLADAIEKAKPGDTIVVVGDQVMGPIDSTPQDGPSPFYREWIAKTFANEPSGISEDELKANPLICYSPGKPVEVPEHYTPRQIVPALQIPPRTIEELIAAMESMFEVGESTDCSTAVTGEPYLKVEVGYVVTMEAPVYDLMFYRSKSFSDIWKMVTDLRNKSGDGAVLY
jgi:hypothetical protein